MGDANKETGSLAKIYIWGTGKYGKRVLQTVRKKNAYVAGFVDNDPARRGKNHEGLPVMSFRDIAGKYDYLVIGIVKYEAVIYQLEMEQGIDFSKVVVFFDEQFCDNSRYSHILNRQKWRMILLEEKVAQLENILKARIDNLGYEIIDKYHKDFYRFPRLGNTKEAICRIVNEGCSLVRFGDGEFEIMAGKERPVFQKYDPKLAERLREVIASTDEKLLVCIANNYGALDTYTEEGADEVRSYMTEETRRFHMSVLSPDRVYYDAYLFKSYFFYKNREDTEKRLQLVKRVWEKRDIVLVEGDKTRTGYGNDLFDNANSVRRILAPTQNAFDRYGEILEAASKLETGCLILIVLGPMSNLLVYDLMKKGYQAIDLGQIDMDYEWYKRGVQKRVPIPGKYVSQLPPAEIGEVHDGAYFDQILEQIR